jgi:hypothetical protein
MRDRVNQWLTQMVEIQVKMTEMFLLALRLLAHQQKSKLSEAHRLDSLNLKKVWSVVLSI